MLLVDRFCGVCHSRVIRAVHPVTIEYLYYCPECSKGDSNSSQELERRKRIYANICPSKYRDFDKARYPERSRDNFNRVMAYDLNLSNGMGLYLYGDGRTGKTRVVYKLLEKAIVNYGKTVIAFEPGAFSKELNKQYKANNFEQWFESLTLPDIVFFDDFGKMTFTDRLKGEFFALIENRTSRGKVIFATDQDDSETLGQKMHDEITAQAIINRLMENCATIRFYK